MRVVVSPRRNGSNQDEQLVGGLLMCVAFCARVGCNVFFAGFFLSLHQVVVKDEPVCEDQIMLGICLLFWTKKKVGFGLFMMLVCFCHHLTSMSWPLTLGYKAKRPE